MAVILVNQIIYQDTVYKCYYDTGDGSKSVQISGSSPLNFIPFPNPQNSGHQGDLINSFCSDNPSTTLVKIFLSQTTPFFDATLTADADECQGGGTPGCDLQINSLDVSNEQEQGGNDGSVNINASSTHGPIQYSLNGSDYIGTTLFGGLSPGNYTAYVKDANNCTFTQPFTILAFNNPVTDFTDGLPVVTIGANTSKWNAAFNPIIVTYQRKDYVVTSITQGIDAQHIVVQIAAVLDNPTFTKAIQNGIYVKTAIYDFTIKPDSYTSGAGFVIKYPFLGNDTAGLLNIPVLKPNFFIQTEITSGNNPVFKDVIIAEHSPNLKGVTKADLAPYLQTLLSTKDLYDYIQINYRDYNLAGSYTLRYREVWDGGNSNWYNGPYPLYYTFAARQLGEVYNGNLIDYVPFESVTLDKYRAKWLTGFNKPTFFAGLPFEISFIYSENIINEQVFLELTSDCGGATDALLLNADATYLLNADNSRFVIQRIYNSGIEGYPIIAQLGVNRVLIPNTFDCCANNIVAQLYINSVGSQGSLGGSQFEPNGVDYVDTNTQVKYNSVELPTGNVYDTSTMAPVNLQAGGAYSINFYSMLSPSAGNPKITGKVFKDGVLIFAQTFAGVPGNGVVKTGIIQPGAVYTWSCVGSNGGADVTPVDIADNNPVVGTKRYIMQPLTIKHICPCDDPFIYLKWINSRGAWDYWRFGYNQVFTSTTNNSEQAIRYVNDWTNDDTIEDFISRNANKKITLVAGQLDKDETEALEWMSNSVKVQMLTSRNPVKWQTVLIPDGDFGSGESRSRSNNVKVQIILPAKNIQHQ